MMSARQDSSAFSQVLSVEQTKTLTSDQLDTELNEYIATYGEAMGKALFDQEYLCSFDAAVLGAVYGSEFRKVDEEDRITEVKHNPNYPVHTAWDIGFSDNTAVWYWQEIDGEIRIIDFHSANLKDPDYHCGQLLGYDIDINIINGRIEVEKGQKIEGLENRRRYEYANIWLPHDGNQRIFAAKGKSIREQLMNVFGSNKVRRVPNLSIQNGIQAARKLLNRCVFDYSTQEGVDTIRQYRYDWNEKKNDFSISPVHDWTSHAADAFRMMALSYYVEREQSPEVKPILGLDKMTFNDLWDDQRKGF